MKNVGSVIHKKVDSICKKRLGKSFGEVISMVPEDGLTKNVSPCCLYCFSITLDQIPELLDVNRIFFIISKSKIKCDCKIAVLLSYLVPQL